MSAEETTGGWKSNDWQSGNCWIAVFDILGFKSRINCADGSFSAALVKRNYDAICKKLDWLKQKNYNGSDLDYCWFSDTFILYTPDDSDKSYSRIQSAAKYFISDCTRSPTPLRGAISVGPLIWSGDRRVWMGPAFLEAYKYAEAQDWIGLILTPQAIERVRGYPSGLDPLHHDFVPPPNDVLKEKIPSRSRDVLAYKWQNGTANFDSPLIRPLKEMMCQCCRANKRGGEEAERVTTKYKKTIAFVEDHYRKHSQ